MGVGELERELSVGCGLAGVDEDACEFAFEVVVVVGEVAGERTAHTAAHSVATGNKLFRTANTLATTINNFTGGVTGQHIVVKVNDVNTTFDFTGSALIGNNGVDYVAGIGDALDCEYDGTNWYCTIIQG